MILWDALLGADIAEHIQLLFVSSAHTFLISSFGVETRAYFSTASAQYPLRMTNRTLHVVDGESTGGSLRQARLGTKRNILSWRDALYTGPVPRGLTLRRLSRLRSRFWTKKNDTEFDQRDATLARHADYDEIVLWFGPTSICQLSLIQLLHWFDKYSRDNTRLRLVSAYGGWLKSEQVLQAHGSRQPITASQMRLGRRVWLAFSSPSPKALSQLLAGDLRPLPDIRDTIGFLLREYPERHSGLSRLEQKLLRTVDSLGITTPAVAVGTILHSELVGDTFLFDTLMAFITLPHPLLRFAVSFDGPHRDHRFNVSQIEVTDTGRAVLAGKADHITLNGVDRWIGGVHLSGHRVPWRWDERTSAILSQRELAVR